MSGRFKRPSPGMLVAVVAVILALAGGAYAATKIGPKQIKPNAVRTSKIQDGAVTTTKLADGAVTSPKLDPSERSDGFVTNQTAQVPIPATTNTTVATLTLPQGGNYIVNSSVELGNNAATAQFIGCELQDDGTTITSGTERTDAIGAFTDTLDLTASSNGGVVTLVCNPDNGAQARNRVITATRVGTLATQ
jgi:hypothetical protein